MADRFVRAGIERWFFVPAILNPAAPTVAEINAGTPLHKAIKMANGFETAADTIEAPDLDSKFVTTVRSMEKIAKSSIDGYRSSTTTDAEEVARAAMPSGAKGYVVIIENPTGIQGPVATKKCDVWPVEVTSNNKGRGAPGEIGQFKAEFSHPAKPSLDVTIAA